MKKLLIYFPESKLAPKGGQAGYLYNLKKGFEQLQENEKLHIDISFYNNAPVRFEDNAKLRNRIPKRILEIRRALNDANFLKKKFPIDESLFDYDMIHFHWTEEVYLNRDFLEKYKGKVILTSHSPCVMFKEKIGKLNQKDYQLLKSKIDRLEEMDRYAFERSDYIIFPCEEAEDPYFHTWEKYAEIRKAEKYRYIPTGIVGCQAKISRADIRAKYNIPDDAFVVSYAGRHNEIKGYADLKLIGEEMLKDNNTYFLIAGKEEPMVGLKNDHWIEVGWTSDPHSLIAASDVFLLPNHETYFDLILLEVLSLGVPVVLSSTGGNKYFSQFHKKGLMFYSSTDEAMNNLKYLKSTAKDVRIAAGKELYELFKEHFSIEPFTRRYLEIISEIANEEKND